MATYLFETISASDALLNFNATTDVLIFTNATSSGSKMSVAYNAATATSAATITITDLVDGKSVTFGPNAAGLGETANNVVFPDGSVLVVDGPSSGSATGSAFNDGLF